MNQFVIKNGKKLRYGYTTGSCATAAAKAAAQMLFTGEAIETVKIDTPKGWQLNIDLVDVELFEDSVTCAVIKDGGDDPDMTNGMKVYARVSRKQVEVPLGEDDETSRIEITGGEGVGRVTKPGLSVSVGKPAINPVPLSTIRKEVGAVLPEGEAVSIEISAPEGVRIAKKTFNPKLGIVGGISIIGTSGIVEPMSEAAIIDTIKIELSVLRKTGADKVMFSPGNYGRDFSQELGLDTTYLVKTSNYIGEILEEAERLGFKKILWVGHIGKMVKVAAGIFNTHSKVCDGRMETLAANVALKYENRSLVEQIMNSNTTDEAIDHIKAAGCMDVMDVITEKISRKSEQKVFEEITVGTILFSNQHGLLGICETGKALMEEFRNE